jgi:hypothetical protein
MSLYLGRLKALAREKHILREPSKPSKGCDEPKTSLPCEPPKPSKAPFEPFEGSQSERISPILRSLTYDPAALQNEADRRNLIALREGRTDRFCACGRLARLAWPDGARREVWRCDDCAPTAGRA